MEMVDAPIFRGLKVTLLQRSESVLKTMDREFGKLVQDELERNGVRVITGVAPYSVVSREGGLVLTGPMYDEVSADMVISGVGCRPESNLAKLAGVTTGIQDAIVVDCSMATNILRIWAAGDCAQTWYHTLKRAVYLPLGTTAHKQGRIAGENAVGGKTLLAWTVGTQVVKIFDLVVARTGLRDEEAKDVGFNPLTVELETYDHKIYYPGAKKLTIGLTGDRTTRRLLGAQIIGKRGTEIAKRIDVFATALFSRMSIDSLNDLDLSYKPPLSSPLDPLQMTAQLWLREK